MTFEFIFILMGLAQIFGFFVEGCAGFGCTVITAPVVTSLLGTAEGVPYGTIMALPCLIMITIKYINDISWKDLGKILIMCAPGMLIGQYLFKTLDPTVAKVGIGGAVTIIATMNIYKHIIKPLVLKKEVNQEDEEDTLSKKIFRYSCLIIGGIVHGAFNIGGPLITVYTLEAVKDKKRFRNTMTCLWVVLNTANAISQYNAGLLTPRMWSAVAVGLPMALLGFFFGVKFLDKINRVQFLRFVYVVLFCVGANMLVSNVIAMMG